jgi:hypothetical protein
LDLVTWEKVESVKFIWGSVHNANNNNNNDKHSTKSGSDEEEEEMGHVSFLNVDEEDSSNGEPLLLPPDKLSAKVLKFLSEYKCPWETEAADLRMSLIGSKNKVDPWAYWWAIGSVAQCPHWCTLWIAPLMTPIQGSFVPSSIPLCS